MSNQSTSEIGGERGGHTPGEWKIERRTGMARAQYGDCVYSEHYNTPGCVSGRGIICDCRGEHGEANASMIAAIPNFLKAIRAFEKWWRREDEGWVGDTSTPEGETACREWYAENIRLFEEAKDLSTAALTKATQST